MIVLLMTNTMYGSLHHSHSLSRHSKSNLRKLSTNFHHFSITIIEEQHRFSSNRLIRLFNIIENSYFGKMAAVVVQRSCLYLSKLKWLPWIWSADKNCEGSQCTYKTLCNSLDLSKVDLIWFFLDLIAKKRHWEKDVVQLIYIEFFKT